MRDTQRPNEYSLESQPIPLVVLLGDLVAGLLVSTDDFVEAVAGLAWLAMYVLYLLFPNVLRTRRSLRASILRLREAVLSMSET